MLSALSMNSNESIIIKFSPINGSGVFATRNICCGEVVVYWRNTRAISQSEFEALPSEEQRYIDIQIDKILLIGTPERFINHSCEANTKPGILCDIALRDIKIGEEITTDYSNFYIPLGPFQCNCNSKNCRRYIQGTSIK